MACSQSLALRLADVTEAGAWRRAASADVLDFVSIGRARADGIAWYLLPWLSYLCQG
jgi:hypothetical protein